MVADAIDSIYSINPLTIQLLKIFLINTFVNKLKFWLKMRTEIVEPL